MDNYYYTCDCDTDFSLLTKDSKGYSRFFCISRINQNLIDTPEEINKPKVSFRRVKVETLQEMLDEQVNRKVPESPKEQNEDDFNFV